MAADASSTSSASRRTQPPLSPHIWNWRWHVTMLTSIAHRASGFALALLLSFLVVWLWSILFWPALFDVVQRLAGSLVGLGVAFVVLSSFFYHFASGLRHLVWDSGHGFSPRWASFFSIFNLVFGAAAAVGVLVAMLLIGGPKFTPPADSPLMMSPGGMHGEMPMGPPAGAEPEGAH